MKMRATYNKEFYQEHYKNRGKSTTQIAREFGYDEATIWRRLKRFGLIRSISEANKGKNNGMWKDNEVGLSALHEWISNHKPKSEFCEDCKIAEPYDLANISQKYLRDVNDFKWLCRSCHMKMDYKNGTRKPRNA